MTGTEEYFILFLTNDLVGNLGLGVPDYIAICVKVLPNKCSLIMLMKISQKLDWKLFTSQESLLEADIPAAEHDLGVERL